MKKILITGANSYIGTSLEKYLKKWPDRYQTTIVDMLDGTWREKSFSEFDVVYHVAGIAHSDTGKVSDEIKARYYRVNTEMAIETAEKAKTDGVKQFIMMSSSVVYGDSAPIGEVKIITRDTPVCPSNFYGDSKAKAEEGIRALEDESFKVAIIRSPMVFGPGCKGNYTILSKLAKKMPAFPDVNNKRSMLYIENLTEFVRLLIEDEARGIFWPQNKEYSSTSQMVKQIAQAHGKKMHLIRGTAWALKLMSHMTALVNKAFGNLCYDMEMSEYCNDYRIRTLEEGIKETEKNEESIVPGQS